MTAMAIAFEAARAKAAQLSDPEAELQLNDDRWAEAHMRAAELDSPNSADFESTCTRIYEQLCEQNWRP